jgi:multiple sugar transport system permease protein
MGRILARTPGPAAEKPDRPGRGNRSKHDKEMEKARVRSRRARFIADRLGSWSFLGLSFLGVMVFFVVPFCVVIYYSMISNPSTGNSSGFQILSTASKTPRSGSRRKTPCGFLLVAVPLACGLVVGAGAAAGMQNPHEEPVPNLLFKPHDGARGVHRPDLAGFVSFITAW